MSYSGCILVLILVFSSFFKLNAQSSFYDINTIQKIEIVFNQSNWDYQMDTSRLGLDGFVHADTIKINGFILTNAGVKYKGNSSYDSTFLKNPIHIELDSYQNQDYLGVKDIKLSNCYADPSMIREVLAYKILSDFMDCPASNFAMLFINGNYIGLYSNDESINKDFCASRFYSDENTFIKCNPVVTPGPTTKSSLRYLTADSSAYFNFYEMKSDFGWKELTNLCDSASNNVSAIENLFDLDRLLWMLAFDNVLVNLDSYIGVFSQNYYLYKDNHNQFCPIVWDLNMSFGGFPYLGSGNTSMNSLSVSSMQQLTLNTHISESQWPLMKAVLSNSEWKKKYIAHARTIVENYFSNNQYLSLANSYRNLIDSAVLADSNKFYSYQDFQNSLSTNIVNGSYTIPGISTLVDARKTYLQSSAEFQYVVPEIDTYFLSKNTPDLGDTVVVTAKINNTINSSIWFYYRENLTQKFSKIQLFDNGQNGDTISGDSKFSTRFVLNSNALDFYFYAENLAACKYLPQEAEHQFFKLFSSSASPSANQVFINELMASNVSYEKDEFGQYEDWIELYNAGTLSIDLGGCFLSDEKSNPYKFVFPVNTRIEAKSFLVIFADEDPSTKYYTHCNFKLSGNGDKILFSDIRGNLLDSVSFGQQTDDYSYGRCPDGIGNFTELNKPSFKKSNCTAQSIDMENKSQCILFPNPAHSKLKIEANKNIINCELCNSVGKCMYSVKNNSNNINLEISDLADGIYFIKITFENEENIVKKFIKN